MRPFKPGLVVEPAERELKLRLELSKSLPSECIHGQAVRCNGVDKVGLEIPPKPSTCAGVIGSMLKVARRRLLAFSNAILGA